MRIRTQIAGGLLAATWLVLHVSCHQAIMTAPPGSTISLFANPPSIPAHGGVSIISALVMEPTGTVVADGTVVQFFTTLGRVDEQGKTNDGVARVNLVSDSRSGEAEVTAFSGGSVSTSGSTASTTATSKVTVTIGGKLPSKVQIVANPSTLTTRRYADIIAFVYDENGNPLSRIPVLFSVTEGDSGPAQWEHMESEGRPEFTDNNGRVHDVLRTSYPAHHDQRTVTVTATTGNGVSSSVKVQINIGTATPTPAPAPTATPTAAPAPTTIQVSAVPGWVDSASPSQIRAYLFDQYGDPMAGVNIYFAFSGTAAQETLDSGGVPVPTDATGLATDILRTTEAVTERTVAVTASTSTGVSAQVQVVVRLP
ncbi:MAG: hypothetical protein JXO72_11620 [Vicinamibacteria bacterium]|nr:hypothetical protein [Vicinamibacteria bacterium]